MFAFFIINVYITFQLPRVAFAARDSGIPEPAVSLASAARLGSPPFIWINCLWTSLSSSNSCLALVVRRRRSCLTLYFWRCAAAHRESRHLIPSQYGLQAGIELGLEPPTLPRAPGRLPPALGTPAASSAPYSRTPGPRSRVDFNHYWPSPLSAILVRGLSASRAHTVS